MLKEVEALCQPTRDPAHPCRGTRVTVEVCDVDTDAGVGCQVRDGTNNLLRALNAYLKYVAELNKR